MNFKYVSTPPVGHRRGSELIFVAIITCVLVSLMGVSLSKLQNVTFQGLFSSEATMQAQYYAKTKMDYLVFNGYNSLAVQDKISIESTEFKDSVALGAVSTDSNGISHRLVTVNVYKDDEIYPRAILKQVFYSNDANKFVINGSSVISSISLNYDKDNDRLYAMVNGEEKPLGGGNGWKPPDYSSKVSVSANNSFVCPSDGLMMFQVQHSATSDGRLYVYFNDVRCITITSNNWSLGYAWIPCAKGDIFKYTLSSASGYGYFFPSRK